MADFLQDMAQASLARAEQAQHRRDMDSLLRQLEASSAPPALKLHETFSVFAEIKAHSPAEGALAISDQLDRAALAVTYADAGASAVSVLTEPSRFDGALTHLSEVALALGLDRVPAMRKDFLVSEYQVAEARAAGAGGVLLIVAMLDDETLSAMLMRARLLQLFVLLECFDRDDIQRCKRLLDTADASTMIDAGQLLLGVNTRNLRTLAVDSERLAVLATELPRDVVCLAESGLKVAEDARHVAALGYRGALIGTALMRSEDRARSVRDFIIAGRGQ